MEFSGAPRRMIVSDLDNTMVDRKDKHYTSLLRFGAPWKADYNHDSLLVYSTGRSPALYAELRSEVPLLTPGITIMRRRISWWRCPAPMSFFDSTPTGRMLSRASTDQAQLDILIPILFGGVLAIGFATAGIFFVVVQVTWQILIFIVPLAGLYYSYQVYYIKTSRELTRVDAVTKAPVIHHFSETIAGLMTIRCFRQEAHFAEVNMERVDTNLSMDFHNNCANEWVGFRFELIGMVILCVTTVFLVAIPGRLLPPGKPSLPSLHRHPTWPLLWCSKGEDSCSRRGEERRGEKRS